MQNKRLNRHKEFMQRVKSVATEIIWDESTPFRIDHTYERAIDQYHKLNHKWKAWVDKRVIMALNNL